MQYSQINSHVIKLLLNPGGWMTIKLVGQQFDGSGRMLKLIHHSMPNEGGERKKHLALHN